MGPTADKEGGLEIHQKQQLKKTASMFVSDSYLAFPMAQTAKVDPKDSASTLDWQVVTNSN